MWRFIQDFCCEAVSLGLVLRPSRNNSGAGPTTVAGYTILSSELNACMGTLQFFEIMRMAYGNFTYSPVCCTPFPFLDSCGLLPMTHRCGKSEATNPHWSILSYRRLCMTFGLQNRNGVAHAYAKAVATSRGQGIRRRMPVTNFQPRRLTSTHRIEMEWSWQNHPVCP